ncbi:MAG: type II toxin-antitoxin system HicB family antitoxin [Acidimicrobiales bacterium]
MPAPPGLIVAGATRAEVAQLIRLIREGIPFHLEGLAEDGIYPDPQSVEVEAITVPGRRAPDRGS